MHRRRGYGLACVLGEKIVQRSDHPVNGCVQDCLTCVGAFQSPAFSYTSIYPSAAVKARHTTDPILRRGASRSGVGALVGLAPRTASLRVVTHKSLPGLSFTDDQGAGKEEAGALFHRGRRSLRTVASAERLAEGAAWSALEDWAKGKGMTWSSWKVGEVNGIRGESQLYVPCMSSSCDCEPHSSSCCDDARKRAIAQSRIEAAWRMILRAALLMRRRSVRSVVLSLACCDQVLWPLKTSKPGIYSSRLR